ncbi:hypothetical protein PoB_003182100 [Plakobranchus ocellatus]|uniref:Uncharacterized protein n=1 Tax=Plakobranchus ocellatus TaxID=259542 RepID=A0AAV4AAG6_9GAST|nr:hypothetical protein PoB_003182100 [Plakobranchus ocellatus]
MLQLHKAVPRMCGILDLPECEAREADFGGSDLVYGSSQQDEFRLPYPPSGQGAVAEPELGTKRSLQILRLIRYALFHQCLLTSERPMVPLNMTPSTPI